jgi:hypothetical protein
MKEADRLWEKFSRCPLERKELNSGATVIA